MSVASPNLTTLKLPSGKWTLSVDLSMPRMLLGDDRETPLLEAEGFEPPTLLPMTPPFLSHRILSGFRPVAAVLYGSSTSKSVIFQCLKRAFSAAVFAEDVGVFLKIENKFLKSIGQFIQSFLNRILVHCSRSFFSDPIH